MMIFPKQNVILDHLYLKVINYNIDDLVIEHGDLRIGIVDSDNVFEKWIDLSNCIGPWYDCVVEPIIYYFTRSDQPERPQSNLLAEAEAMYHFIRTMYNVLQYNNMKQYSVYTLNELRDSAREYNYPVACIIEKALIDKIEQLLAISWENTDGGMQDKLSFAMGVKTSGIKEFVVHDGYWNNAHVYKFYTNDACWIDFIQPLAFVLVNKKRVSVSAVETFINLAKAYDSTGIDKVNPFEAEIKDDTPYAIQIRELIKEVKWYVEHKKAQE